MSSDSRSASARKILRFEQASATFVARKVRRSRSAGSIGRGTIDDRCELDMSSRRSRQPGLRGPAWPRMSENVRRCQSIAKVRKRTHRERSARNKTDFFGSATDTRGGASIGDASVFFKTNPPRGPAWPRGWRNGPECHVDQKYENEPKLAPGGVTRQRFGVRVRWGRCRPRISTTTRRRSPRRK